MASNNPIIVALDVPTAEQALSLARQLAPVVGAFKVGSELFTAAGPEMVRQLRALGAEVFLDLKYHDIPNTVARAVAAAVRLQVSMLTIHTCGGLAMMKAAEEAARNTALQAGLDRVPLVLGVTVLTSMDTQELARVGVPQSVGHQVERLASLAFEAGLRGLVCSPLELTMLRSFAPRGFQLVTPGIRGPEDALGDQKRVLSAREAMDAGANYLVIGRPICAAPDPRAAAEKILASLH
ncbi:MAG: orotidine-5'-phosphate decarboxylase [Verrucomicrobiae bacterium]|nr:orotidine-5'-phosphate decarboxylase [Verrucomicrobiae bacterium]